MTSLKVLYARVNMTCFSGMLPDCVLRRGGCRRQSEAQFEVYKGRWGKNVPAIAIRRAPFDEADLVKLLIHEMTHFEEHLAYPKNTPQPRKDPHTRKFFLKIRSKELTYQREWNVLLDRLSTDFTQRRK